MKTIQYKGRDFQIPARDNQRSRVYRAEANVDVPEGGMLEDLAACQAYANRITGSATWKKLLVRHGRGSLSARTVQVQQAPHGGATAWPAWWLIRISRSCMTKSVMLHELAHILVGPNVGHHWPWCKAYADLVGRVLGDATRRSLLAELKRAGAKYSQPHPPLSEERKRQLAEQGRKALGLKKPEEKS